MERICCFTTLKATGTWVSGGRGYSRVLEHSLGETYIESISRIQISVEPESMLAVGRTVYKMATALQCTTMGTNTLANSSKRIPVFFLHFSKLLLYSSDFEIHS